MVYGSKDYPVVFEKERLLMTWRWYYENFMWMLKGYPLPRADPRKRNTVVGYARHYGITTLVETGTYLGQMVNDTKDVFDLIFSIELDKHLYDIAAWRFADTKNVYLFQGDSARLLPVIISGIRKPILFWLDAHYSGGATSRGDIETPVLFELRTILKHPDIRDHVILIDDARLFENQTPGYPSLADLREIIYGSGNELTLHVEDDIIRIHHRTRCYP